MPSVRILHAPIALLTVACSTADPPAVRPDATVIANADTGLSTAADTGLSTAADAGLLADAEVEPDAGLVVDSGLPPDRALSWAPAMPPPGNNPNWGARLVYVPGESRFILFGGDSYPVAGTMGDTWSLSATDGSWTKLEVSGDIPPPRYCYCAVYLPDSHEVLLVGGRNEDAALPPAAFTLDLSTLSWRQIQGDTPRGVIGCSVEWMPRIGRAIVYGGGGSRSVFQETWSYDPVARGFTLLGDLSQSPPGRADAPSFYDPVSGRMFVFSGTVRAVPPFQMRDDLWAFDGQEWGLVETSTSPGSRRFSASAYDPIGARWYVFGGSYGPADRDDLWSFEPASNTWTKIDLADPPSARAFSASSYDPIAHALLLVGGLTVDFRAFSDGYRLLLPTR